MRSVQNNVRAILFAGVSSLLLLLLAGQASAALISWEAPAAIVTSNATQVITTGTLVAQGEQRSPSQTVNGVTFGPFSAGSVNVTVSNASGAVAGAYGPDDTAYAKLASAGIYRANGGYADILISGLTSGTGYDLQLFTPFWDVDYQTRFSEFSDGTNGVDMGNTKTQPTYVIGHFTASASTQDVFFTAAGTSPHGLFAAIEVRTAIPEPACAIWLGGCLLALRRRAKRST
jgi:hypothetical protein